MLFNCADVGCFPSYREPFGLVFIECMACATPVIGADSGGPRDFVTPKVGVLVPETDDHTALAQSLAAAVNRALDEGWKQTKGPTAQAYAKDNFSLVSQVCKLLTEVDRLTTSGSHRPGARGDGQRQRAHRTMAGPMPGTTTPQDHKLRLEC